MLWSKVIADGSQRFGPAVFLLAIAGLVVNCCKRIDLQFALVLLVQLGFWMGLTHLYARFAVVFLVPLVILGGRFLGEVKRPWQKAGLLVLCAGVVWNLMFAVGLYRKHLYVGTERLSIEGTPEVFTSGRIPGCQHLAVINGELPEDARVLLVGEARAFYCLRDNDYTVVFNRNPFAEAVAIGPAHVREWLGVNGYTHVYVGWAEIDRLRRSRYGFPEAVTRASVNELASAGVLRRTHTFDAGERRMPYGELYEVVLPNGAFLQRP